MPLTPMPYAEWKHAALQGKIPTDDVVLYKDCGLPEVKILDEGQGSRCVRIRLSTATVDRDNDTIAVEGWNTRAYEKNPVVLYGHNYWGLPIGKAIQLHQDTMSLSAVDAFVPKEIDPFAETVYQMLKHGFLNTASVGFRQLEYTINEDRRGVDFLRQELLEHSIVPVPSNPDALIEARHIFGVDAMAPLIQWCERTLDTWRTVEAAPIAREQVEAAHARLTPIAVSVVGSNKGVTPEDVSRRTAPHDTPWERPSASDFSEEAIDTLSDATRRRIAGHFAWTEKHPPSTYGQLKLPHHRPDDGDVVWRGVTAAMAALLGARGGVTIPDGDREAVYAHLASHYRQFDAEPPAWRYVHAEALKHLSADYQFNACSGQLTQHAVTTGRPFARILNDRIAMLVTEDRTRAEIIADMGRAAGMDPSTVNQILAESIDCPPWRFQDFARALDLSGERLREAAEAEGDEYERGDTARQGQRSATRSLNAILTDMLPPLDPVTELMASMEAHLPTLIRTAVQHELTALTGRLPD